MQHREDINVLRGFAVAAVVVFHYYRDVLPGGYLGVDIFFAISGYLILGALYESIRNQRKISAQEFTLKRIRRIVPALAVVTTGVLLLAPFFYFGSALKQLAGSAVSVSTASSNHFFFKYSNNYFAPNVDFLALLNTWSLSVEIQFYIGVSILIVLLNRLKPEHQPKAFVRVLAVCCAASVVAYHVQQTTNFATAFYFTALRAWEFSAGGLTYVLARHRPWQLGRPATEYLRAVLIAALLALCLTTRSGSALHNTANVLTILVTCAYMLIGQVELAGQSPFIALLRGLKADWLGRISYSLYLWHWPIHAFASSYYGTAPPAIINAGALVASLIIAHLSFLFVERPVLDRKGLFAQPKSLYVTFALSILAINLFNPLYRYFSEHAEYFTGKNLKTNTTGYQRPYDCDKNRCDFTVGPSVPSIFFWGDSHAGHFEPMLATLYRDGKHNIRLRSSGGCPPLLHVVPKNVSRIEVRCQEYNRKVLDEILNETGELGAVVLAARWQHYLGGRAVDALEARSSLTRLPAGPEDTIASALLEQDLAELVALLETRKIRVILVGPTPEFPYDPLQCLYRKVAESCALDRGKTENDHHEALAILSRIADQHRNVLLWNPKADLCTASQCQSIRLEKVLYSDSNHLTPDGNTLLIAPFSALLKRTH